MKILNHELNLQVQESTCALKTVKLSIWHRKVLLILLRISFPITYWNEVKFAQKILVVNNGNSLLLLLTIHRSTWTLAYVLRKEAVKGNGCENTGSNVIVGFNVIDMFNQYECERKYRFIMFMLYTSLDRIAHICCTVFSKYYIWLMISKSFAWLCNSTFIHRWS